MKAKEASETAVSTIKASIDETLDVMMEKVNRSLAKTRGAVVSIVKINTTKQHISYTGVGNIVPMYNS